MNFMYMLERTIALRGIIKRQIYASAKKYDDNTELYANHRATHNKHAAHVFRGRLQVINT